VEVVGERSKESFVIEELVDLGEFAGQHAHPGREKQLEQRARRAYSSQLDGLRTYTRGVGGHRTEHPRVNP
jgi:hypothetical protein